MSIASIVKKYSRVCIGCTATAMTIVFLGVSLFSRPMTMAAEPTVTSRTLCNVPWIFQLETNTLNVPKPYYDNTNAAYAGFMFVPEPNTRLQLSGSFPAAEFMSLETDIDHIFDYQMQPAPGATNPFVTGANLSALNKAFFLEMRREGSESTIANSIEFGASPEGSGTLVALRIYAPYQTQLVITSDDLPKVYAVSTDPATPAKCPTFTPALNGTKAEQYISGFIASGNQLLAESTDSTMQFLWLAPEGGTAGINAATYYITNNNTVLRGNVAMIRLKNPQFANTHSGKGTKPADLEARGWVVCVGDFQTFYTFGCVPDWSAKTDANGFVTVVVGNSYQAKLAAEKSGANFLWDTRPQTDIEGKTVTSMGFYLRNLLPNCQFAETKMYAGDYCPKGIICSNADYIAGKCVLPAQEDCYANKPAIVCPG